VYVPTNLTSAVVQTTFQDWNAFRSGAQPEVSREDGAAARGGPAARAGDVRHVLRVRLSESGCDGKPRGRTT